jgi:hypothetical protein
MIPAPDEGLRSMSSTTCHISISLDGYVAGPDQSPDDPLGRAACACMSGSSRPTPGAGSTSVAGGAGAVQQYLAAGMLDELFLHIVPVVFGAGERLLEHVGDPVLEPVEVIASPAVTHVRYRVAPAVSER